jgi:hypothetical protein
LSIEYFDMVLDVFCSMACKKQFLHRYSPE